MEEDVLGSPIISEDSGFDEPQKAVKVTGNNNCLWLDALSLLLLAR